MIIGTRVQLSPATDRWMRGDRYGVITGIGTKYVYVKLDRSGRTVRLFPDYVSEV